MLANWGHRHFRSLRTFWGTAVLFINAKLNIGNRIERLNCIAQVVAERDGWFEVPQPKHMQIFYLLLDGPSTRDSITNVPDFHHQTRSL